MRSIVKRALKMLVGLIRKGGIPAAHRGVVWLHISGAKGRQQSASTSYRDILRTHEGESSAAIKQIEKVRILLTQSNVRRIAGSWPYTTTEHTFA